jgi:hypothetical protein
MKVGCWMNDGETAVPFDGGGMMNDGFLKI